MKGSKRVHSSDSSTSDSDSENVTPKERASEINSNRKAISVKSLHKKIAGSAFQVINGEVPQYLSPVVVLNRTMISSSVRKSLAHGQFCPSSPVVANPDANEHLEMQQRRDQRIQRRSLHSTPDTRKTASEIPLEQLKDHYAVCIKLSASNKITTKNAFVLHLIDYLSDMIKREGQMNFKLASSALDAGTKIYSNRVECVHAEAQKVASGLVMATSETAGDKNADEANVDEGEGEEAAGVSKPKKKKTYKPSGKTITTNLESITVSKVETALDIDPLFHHISSGFDMGSVISLLMANLKHDGNYQLMLDSTHNTSSNSSSMTSIHVPIKPFTRDFNNILHNNIKICPKISEFEFLNRNEGLNLASNYDIDEESAQLRASIAKTTSLVFDMNKEIENEEMDDFSPVNDFFDGDIDDADQEQVTQRKSLIRSINPEHMQDLLKFLSSKPSEYSYFNRKLLSTWAGPEHWKANPFLRFKRKEGQKPPVSVRKMKNQFEEINFDEDLIMVDKVSSAKLKTRVPTLKKWVSSSNNDLPIDYGYDPKSLTVPFIKANFCFGSLKNKDIPEADGVPDTSGSDAPDIGIGIGGNDYDDDDQPNSGAFPLEEYGETGTLNPAPSSTAFTIGDLQPFSGDNLVEKPEEIEKIQLNYAKFAKRINVKQLKSAMWNVLTKATDIAPTKSASFADIYKTVPTKVPPLMAENLSAPIAFVTLLHLANEKQLRLTSLPEMTDFRIEQESDRVNEHLQAQS